ncbi:MAG: hypothetical protein N2692_01955 [Patescibacteria group bacterium]|jgi:hypothetical protein|nr:hypothetical protein [Patescibacteria group bacterium]
MALKDIEEKLYKMKEGSPLEEEETPSFKKEKIETTEIISEKPSFKIEVKPKRPPINFYQKSGKKNAIFYVVIGILFAALLFEGYLLAQKLSSQKTGIQININSTDNVLLGQVFPLDVVYKNDSANLLQNTSLIVELPNNIKILGSENNGQIFRKELGDLGTGSNNVERLYLVAMGTPNRIDTIKATLQYNIVGFSGRFEKSKIQTITIGGPIIDYNLSVPEKIVSGEEFTIKVNFKNNSNQTIPELRLQLYYPLGFNFTNSDIASAEGNNLWIWGNLQPYQSGEINIRGIIIGEVGSYYEIGMDASLISQNQPVVFDKKTTSLSILEAPLNVAIYVNNSRDYIARNGESLEYRIDYQNNTEIALSEVIIKAELEGAMFNYQSIATNGYFDSLKKQIIWNAGNTPGLKLLDRGKGGSVTFKVFTTSDYPARSFKDKEQTLKVKVTVESPSVPPKSNLTSTTAVAQIITKILGRVDFQYYALFRDAASGIVNKGSLPLKVGKTTNFTIHWKIINYNNDLSEVTIKTILPQGIAWTNVIAGNYGDLKPEYNERTGELVWRIKEIPAFSGVLMPPYELIFQIAATPSLNQVGSYMELIKETTFTATDKFTGQSINLKTNILTSELRSDPTVKYGEGQVQY